MELYRLAMIIKAVPVLGLSKICPGILLTMRLQRCSKPAAGRTIGFIE